MKKNVGNIDKIVRIIIAIVAFYFAYTTLVSPWNYVLYAVGGIMVVTSLFGCCPLFSIFGVNTCKVKEQ